MTRWKKFNRNRQRKARRFHGKFTQTKRQPVKLP